MNPTKRLKGILGWKFKLTANSANTVACCAETMT